ncbi:MAG: Dam family site-specific DNA-(adenine-N6)-methyltransferase [Selenomonadaceae bacterium]|nr:Dam family site-specific DNA-(adenine-N6)-methyltransferase [Selenomonadaceae bacterium]
MASNEKMFPILKWAGGKTQILDKIIQNMPCKYNNYYEPFLGGASVLLNLAPNKPIFVNDINRQLVNLYTQLKENVEKVIQEVNKMDSTPCNKDLYYEARKKYNDKIAKQIFDAEAAALMIWLNKHCFNGLYRVNRQGFFNVPFNNKFYGKSINENNVRVIADYLKKSNITITCLDFEVICANVEKGDFVYFDSPYAPESVTASFTNYTFNGFSLADHERLASLFKRLDKLGAKIMLSNNDVPLIKRLYAGYNIHSFDVKRMINRDANKRFGREVIITNY